MDLIEEELSNIINAPESDYDPEDPFFDENEPTPFERGYEKILAIIEAAKEGEERLYEYVRRQAEFLGIIGKHARGLFEISALLFEITRLLDSVKIKKARENALLLDISALREGSQASFLTCSLPPPPSPFRSLAQQARERF